MLYPKMNKHRDLYSLNGLWNFLTVNDEFVPLNKSEKTMIMPVPASYNDLVTDRKLVDYVGKVLYETEFSVPIRDGKIYRLRIGATSHKCDIYLNGELIGKGINGYYPIDLPLLSLKDNNRLSVVIDNRLTGETLPTSEFKDGKQVATFDFFNYTGIHRNVCVYTVNENYIEDITVNTVVGGDYKKISVDVKTECKDIAYTVTDKKGNVVYSGKNNDFEIENPILWDTENPHLYLLKVETESDEYELKFGIRKVEVTPTRFLLNGKPVYFKGFGLHEDFLMSGKGINSPLNVRTFEMIKWINANSIRTSHYPYSEEIMDLADEYGVLVIDEVPAVGMTSGLFKEEKINDNTKELHKELIRQLVARDKNHPCVVMYSVANEPGTDEPKSRPYFEDIFACARSVTDLPITLVNNSLDNQLCVDLCDVICVNRYYAWYTEEQDVSQIEEKLTVAIEHFRKLGGEKPLIVSEFGADTLEGNHSLPADMFTEEYQLEFVREYCKVFDSYDYCIGEHVWNFSDFKTAPCVWRVRGNRKGIFTRERQPKLVAHFFRDRWGKIK